MIDGYAVLFEGSLGGDDEFMDTFLEDFYITVIYGDGDCGTRILNGD